MFACASTALPATAAGRGAVRHAPDLAAAVAAAARLDKPTGFAALPAAARGMAAVPPGWCNACGRCGCDGARFCCCRAGGSDNCRLREWPGGCCLLACGCSPGVPDVATGRT